MPFLFLIMKQLEVQYNGVNHSDKGGEQIWRIKLPIC